MKRLCISRGCGRPVAGYDFGRLCSAHRHRHRRHGHPEQLGITRAELKPLERRVEGLVGKRPDAPGWIALDQRWEDIVEHARSLVEAAKLRPYSRHEYRAAVEILKIAEGATGRAVWTRVAALYALQEEQPQRFRSDRAFNFEMARTVRRLSAVSVSQYYNANTGRTKLVYRDPPPKAIEYIAAWLRAAFGFAGLSLAREWREEGKRRERASADISEAVKEAVRNA